MSFPLSVTDCFLKQLKSLRLNEYPCVGKNLKSKKKLSEEQKEVENEVEEQLDLIKDKKSPWYEVYDWSKNCDSIREKFIKDKKSINLNTIELYFTSLRLNDKNIEIVDSSLKNFSNLEELILTCNRIVDIDFSNLPQSVKILDLSANYISNMSTTCKLNIQHLALAYNKIINIENFFNPKYWSSLVSLDLSWNNIDDLVSVNQELSALNNLKILILCGNPIVLLPGYRGLIVDYLPNLFSLDDAPISREEKINYQDFQLYSNKLNQYAEIEMNFIQMRNLIFPEIPEFEDEPEIYVYRYVTRFKSINDEAQDEFKYESSAELEPSTNIDLNDKGIVKLKYKSIGALREFFKLGTEIELIEKKIYYKSKIIDSTAAQEDDKKNKKKSSKDEKKDDKKDNKKKKKQTFNFLDNYSQVNVEEKVLAKFKLELDSLLDGHLREIKKNFSCKLQIDSSFAQTSPKPDSKKKKETKSAQKKDAKQTKKTDLEVSTEPVEIPPFELDIKFQILNFNNFLELKNYYEV